MGKTNHVPTAGESNHSTSRITEVSVLIVVVLSPLFTNNSFCPLGNREINILHVKCSNANRGCEWVGTVGTLEEHVATCKLTLVPCPKQCKDDNDAVKCLLKKDLEGHLQTDCPNRDHECKHCGKKSPYAFITQVHDGKCRKKVILCPNAGCGDTMERQQVRKHVRTKCLYAVTPCKYKLGHWV